tara:strand:- start:1583 stop:1945 length:363 start_codon:yes stop_codon:yes gene_type:complete
MSDNQDNQDNEEDKILSSVTYYIHKDDGQVYMDVHLQDYDEETLETFAKIISGLSSFRFQLQTIEMIKNSFAESGDMSSYEILLKKIVKHTEHSKELVDSFLDSHNQEDEPWIKPSQVIK